MRLISDFCCDCVAWYMMGWIKVYALVIWVLDEHLFDCSWQRLCDHNEYLISGIDMAEERRGRRY